MEDRKYPKFPNNPANFGSPSAGILTFDFPFHGTPLEIKDGVCAFDPVTLKLAAELGASRGLLIRAPQELNQPAPQTLESLAVLTVDPEDGIPASVSVLIDTKKLRWDSAIPTPDRCELLSYKNRWCYGVETSRPVHRVHGRPVMHLPMRTVDDRPVTLWMTELPEELQSPDSAQLYRLAVASMEGYRGAEELLAHLPAEFGETQECWVQFPALQVDYQTGCGDIEVQEPYAVAQRFALAVSEEGARAIVETFIGEIGVPADCPPPPPEVHFGENGPVLMWFAEDNSPLPFCIVYTEQSAWADEDDEIDLDELKLPKWKRKFRILGFGED